MDGWMDGQRCQVCENTEMVCALFRWQQTRIRQAGRSSLVESLFLFKDINYIIKSNDVIEFLFPQFE
jgi:hypothetical protein